jgi:hypothetical protein
VGARRGSLRRLDIVAGRAFRSLRAEVEADGRPWPTSPTSGSVDPATMSPAELAVALDVSTKPRG